MKHLIFILALTSCSQIPDDDYTYIDPKLKPHWEAFLKEASQRRVTIEYTNPKIIFGDLKGKAAGMAYHNTETIVIDSVYDAWLIQPEQLLFHELGHLYLHREHDDRLDCYNLPVSIMHYNRLPFYNSRFGQTFFMYDRKYYMDELFEVD